MRKSRAITLVCLLLAAAVVAVGAVWLWTGGEQAGSARPGSVRLDGEAGDGDEEPESSPESSQCERYLHWSNLDAGCLEPSGALTATIGSETLDTTDAHVTCELDGYRLEIGVDTLERLDDEGAFWAVLWGKDTQFDVIELGVGYGRNTPDGGAGVSVYYRKNDAAQAPPPLSVTRDGRTLTISGERPPVFDNPAIPVTMTVTCPTDF